MPPALRFFCAAVRTGVNFPGVFKFNTSCNDITEEPSSVFKNCVVCVERSFCACVAEGFSFSSLSRFDLHGRHEHPYLCSTAPHLETMTKPFKFGSMASSTVSGDSLCLLFGQRPSFVSTDSLLACNSCCCCCCCCCCCLACSSASR